MLHVFFDHCKGVEGWKKLSDTKNYFNSRYKPEWMNDPFVKKIIKEIDKSEAVQDDLILNYLGRGMSPVGLSTGCKTLILLYEWDNVLIAGERMGDNCYNDLIFQIAEKKDIYITLTFVPELPDEFNIYVENFKKVVHTRGELVDLYLESDDGERERWMEGQRERTPEERAESMAFIRECYERIKREKENGSDIHKI